MEKYEKGEGHPMEKYIGRSVRIRGMELEVVGYSHDKLAGTPVLIVDASPFGGWSALDPSDVVSKECECYWYASINDLIY